MRLLDLIEGSSAQSQHALDQLYCSTGSQERVLWYPSAGGDFRDLLEMGTERRRRHGIKLEPNVICHTDRRALSLQPMTGVIHDDGRTRVECLARYPLQIRPGLCIDWASYPLRGMNRSDSEASKRIELMRIRVLSQTLGIFERSILYFVIDNHHFLEQVLLRHQIKLSHLVKVRQGGWSTRRGLCLSVIYALMGNLGLKYLVADTQAHFCPHEYQRLASRLPTPHEGFNLRVCTDSLTWSGLDCGVYAVRRNATGLTHHQLRHALRLISQNQHFQFCTE